MEADIAFIGDVHRRWNFVRQGLAGMRRPPRAAVLLGDMECDAPLDDLVAPLLDAGIAVHWIFGNHDYDDGPEMWSNLSAPDRNPRTAGNALHARVAVIGGLRVAGLGGTFRARVWEPPAPPRLRRRAELADDLAELGPGWSEDQRSALGAALSAMAIWPEDVELLMTQRADVLVTHEAPSSHPAGSALLDDIARGMGARTIVHGHHHANYAALADDGLGVIGVGAGWGVGHDGRPLWPGEPPRWLGPPPRGWRHAECRKEQGS